jgi:hypothetical protein
MWCVLKEKYIIGNVIYRKHYTLNAMYKMRGKNKLFIIIIIIIIIICSLVK